MGNIDTDAQRLAEVAYNGYGENRGWVVASGAPMPKWHEQGEAFRRGWVAATEAVLQELRNTGNLK